MVREKGRCFLVENKGIEQKSELIDVIREGVKNMKLLVV